MMMIIVSCFHSCFLDPSFCLGRYATPRVSQDVLGVSVFSNPGRDLAHLPFFPRWLLPHPIPPSPSVQMMAKEMSDDLFSYSEEKTVLHSCPSHFFFPSLTFTKLFPLLTMMFRYGGRKSAHPFYAYRVSQQPTFASPPLVDVLSLLLLTMLVGNPYLRGSQAPMLCFQESGIAFWRVHSGS